MLNQADYDALVPFREGPARITDSSPRLQQLIAAKFLQPHTYKAIPISGVFAPIPELWKLTIAGEDALSEFEQAREQEADRKRHQRLQEQISIAQVLVPLVIFILGLIVEHFSGLVGAVLKLFG